MAHRQRPGADGGILLGRTEKYKILAAVFSSFVLRDFLLVELLSACGVDGLRTTDGCTVLSLASAAIESELSALAPFSVRNVVAKINKMRWVRFAKPREIMIHLRKALHTT